MASEVQTPVEQISPQLKNKKPMPNIPAVEKPDEKKFKFAEDNLKNEINKLIAVIKKKDKEMKSKREGKSDYDRVMSELRTKLDVHTDAINKLLDEKSNIQNHFTSDQEQSRTRQKDLPSGKKGVTYETEEQIMSRLRLLENKLISSTLSIADEKAIVAEFTALEAMKPKVAKYISTSQEAKKLDVASMVPLKQQLEKINDQLKEAKDAKKIVFEKLSAIRNEWNARQEPLKRLFTEKNELQTEIEKKKKELFALKQEHQQAHKKYSDYQNEMRGFQRNAKISEKKRRLLIDKKKKLQMDLDDLDTQRDQQLSILMMTIDYVNKIISGKKKSSENTASVLTGDRAAEDVDQSRADDQYVLLAPNKERDPEFFIAPTKVKQRAKPKRKQMDGNSPISHEVDQLADFERIGVLPPMIYSDLEKCLNELNQKQLQLKLDREEKEPEEEQRRQMILKQLDEIESQIQNVEE